MKNLNLLALTIALMFAVTSGLQAQCQVNFNTTISGNVAGFSANVSGINPSAVDYYWDFGDNTGSYANFNPTHTYNIPGVYTVCLTIQDSFAGCFASYCDTIIIMPDPCANFSSSIWPQVDTAYASNGLVNFYSSSSGGTPPFIYNWDFGDGTTSTLQDPIHQYTSSNQIYLACLTVTDINNCTAVICDTILPQNHCFGLDASYSSSVAPDGLANFVPIFNGGTLTNYYWTFGDGSNSTSAYPSHLYTTSGIYTVTFYAGFANGCTRTYQSTVTVNISNNCQVSFTSNTYLDTLVLTSNTQGMDINTTVFIWDLGDGSAAYEATVQHIYSNPGLYIVCLQAIDTASNCQVTYCDSIMVGSAFCTDNLVTLKLEFDNYAYETSWNITNANGTIVGSGNSYNNSNNGTTIYENLCLPAGCYDFNIYDSYGDGICCQWGQGSYTLFDASNNILFSGGTFANSKSTNFCVGGATNPCANFYDNTFTYTIGQNGEVTFIPSFGSQHPLNISWSFGDGTSSTQTNPAAIFSTNGYYVVCMTADSASCATTFCDTVMVQNTNSPNGGICSGLTAEINMYQDSTSPFVVWMQPVVNNAASNSQFTFVWDFGDNTGAFSGNPSHQYTNYGSYIVCLMAFDNTNNCVATICDTMSIDSSGNFNRSTNFTGIKPGLLINTLPAVINLVTSVSTIENEGISLNLYPNPASTSINLVVNSKEDWNGTISLLDITGKVLYQQNTVLAAGEQEVNLSVRDLAAGVYLVRLTGNLTNKVMKFIKE